MSIPGGEGNCGGDKPVGGKWEATVTPPSESKEPPKVYQAELQAKLQEEMEQTTQYVKRESFIQEFFAYETLGATIPHTGTMVKTDDPELMEALHKAEQEGRVVYDKDGSIIEIKDGAHVDLIKEMHEYDKRVIGDLRDAVHAKTYDGTEPWVVSKEVAEKSQEIAAQVSKEFSDAMPPVDMSGITITAHKLNADGSETMSMVFLGCQTVPGSKTVIEDDDVQPTIVEDKK